jgi:hypothetical protein
MLMKHRSFPERKEPGKRVVNQDNVRMANSLKTSTMDTTLAGDESPENTINSRTLCELS